ncbi:antibiotic biosynthesis monooxygenase [Verrucosispora sp. WMMA2044]|uniref:Antibiotic biosynthesis monooxygenase n=1 Tax=Verrucosispora sioxanthis TaxID=2499994 RepID=A0A6M1LD45_9ACTN|nr:MULTISPECIES: antibiotic biosynthesis monooxygenase family protein [Micromonospora]NEE66991.1 antibiotic biosynthesis monooxygenase [Verrucosispora sioxanthis]NGM16101.1 antibiotic biosynthesis monooxygenase [Verrucosispora sioxanthis]WBB47453.1 antibiotic biosynthesis monooxygenase [Verrucosispora sp. WMMA2044]
MLIVAGTLQVEPAGRDDYLATCAEIVRQAREAPGCLDFAISADLIEPGRINVYERWESEEQLLDFRGSGPEPEQQVAIVEAEVQKFLISTVESP